MIKFANRQQHRFEKPQVAAQSTTPWRVTWRVFLGIEGVGRSGLE